MIKPAQFLPTFLFHGLIAFVEFVRLIVDGNGEDIPHNNRNGEVMCCYYLLQYKMFALIEEGVHMNLQKRTRRWRVILNADFEITADEEFCLKGLDVIHRWNLTLVCGIS